MELIEIALALVHGVEEEHERREKAKKMKEVNRKKKGEGVTGSDHKECRKSYPLL